jgi:hypothetical protein
MLALLVLMGHRLNRLAFQLRYLVEVLDTHNHSTSFAGYP